MILSKTEATKTRKIFSPKDLRIAAAFKVLSDVNRYRIFRLLTAEPKLSVSNISQILNISLPLASQHIKILAAANFLQKERHGKKIYTKLERANPFVPAIVKTIQLALK